MGVFISSRFLKNINIKIYVREILRGYAHLFRTPPYKAGNYTINDGKMVRGVVFVIKFIF